MVKSPYFWFNTQMDVSTPNHVPQQHLEDLDQSGSIDLDEFVKVQVFGLALAFEMGQI